MELGPILLPSQFELGVEQFLIHTVMGHLELEEMRETLQPVMSVLGLWHSRTSLHVLEELNPPVLCLCWIIAYTTVGLFNDRQASSFLFLGVGRTNEWFHQVQECTS